MEDKNKTETRTPKVTKGTETPETRAEVANGSAIIADPVESGPETRQVVYENMPKVVNGAAVSVKEGTVITVKTDERNILQKGLDSIAEVFTNIDGWLEDTAEEMADYDYGGWLNIFAEYGQGYAGRGGSFTVARLLGCVTKGGEKLCYGIFPGSINLFSHPIQAAGSIDKIPEGVQEGWNQYKNGNWTQRVEIATEAAGIVALLTEAGVRMKNARNAAKARAEMESILAGDAEAINIAKIAEAGELAEGVESVGKVKIESVGETPGYVNTCFVKGTLILTEKNLKNIEEIKENELIWSKDVKTGKMGLKRVLQVFMHYQDYFVYIYVNGDIIKTTANHPFWIQKKGWVHAEDIKIGDLLKNSSGDNVMIDFVEIIHIKERIVVYNIEVEEWHTYFVSKNNILVHNKANLHNMPGWIKHDVYNDIRNRFGLNGVKKFVNSMKKGIVGGKGENGVKMFSGKGVKVGDKFYQYEIKIKGGLGDWRVFGNYDSVSGHIIFDKFTTGVH